MMTLSRKAQIALFILCGILLAVLPFLVGKTLGNSWVRTLDFALLYIMLALGLNIVVGFAGLLDLGYIAFMPWVPTPMRCSTPRTSTFSGRGG